MNLIERIIKKLDLPASAAPLIHEAILEGNTWVYCVDDPEWSARSVDQLIDFFGGGDGIEVGFCVEFDRQEVEVEVAE